MASCPAQAFTGAIASSKPSKPPKPSPIPPKISKDLEVLAAESQKAVEIFIDF